MTSSSAADVVIIGGGIVGTAAAYFLARSGADVVVLDRDPAPCQASVRNGGGIRAQCRNRLERLLAMRSIELWHELHARTRTSFEYRAAGNLRMALSSATLARLDSEGQEEERDGLHVEMWQQAELRRRAPYLDHRFAGAKYCATDGHANPILATWMLVEAASSAGARRLPAATATAIETRGGRIAAVGGQSPAGAFRIETPTVVHAAGPWTRQLATDAGVDLPIVPARNTMFVTQAAPPVFGEFVSSHEVGVYLRQAAKGHIHVGGVFTTEGTFDQSVSVSELERMARAAEILPLLRELNVLRAWAGTLDMTPDHMPVVGAVPGLAGYFVAAGFSGHGFCLGPAVGELLGRLVRADPPLIDMPALSPRRFGRGEARP